LSEPHRVTLIPGDGIGPSICESAVAVIEATGVKIEWDIKYAGPDAEARGLD
jgi:isocitrate dehydrogenase (NAD+)